MAYGKRALFEDQRSIANGSIGASYSVVGSAFDHPVRMLLVQNLTDATVQFSMDGTNDHFPLQALTQVIFDFTSNAVDGYAFFFGKGDGVYVKQLGAPTTGSVYVSVIYGKGD